jgi:hypothetical protein
LQALARREGNAPHLDANAGAARAEPRPAGTASAGAAEPELALGPEQAARAGELARRERRIRERLQAILGERVVPQQTIRSDAMALGRELEEFRDRVRGLSDRAQYPAQEAANHVAVHSPQAMDQGVAHLAGGQARAARDDQRRASELLERGAQLAEDVAAALRSERPDADAGAENPEKTGIGRGRAAEAIGDARDQMRRASHELEDARDPAHAGHAGAGARQAMLRAAQDLRAAALQAGELLSAIPGFDEGSESGHSADGESQVSQAHSSRAGSTRDPESGPGGKAQAELAELKALVRRKTGRAWGELPGHLRNELLQMQAGRYRENYARIIQLYFREIASGAGTGAAGSTKP